MKTYLGMMEDILKNGSERKDRTGTGTLSKFGYQLRFDMNDGFPLITTKKIHWKSVAHELLWFISGSTNIKYLKDNGVKIWDEWANKNGELGPVYGKQWRAATILEPYSSLYPEITDCTGGDSVDQLGNVIEQIKEDPTSRRLIVDSWNLTDLPKMALPPCHCFFQFYVNDGDLSLQLYQRSADVFLGVPFNIASYSLLLHMVAQVTGTRPAEFIWTSGDTHLYKNHTDQCREQLSRKTKPLPQIKLNSGITNINDFKFKDIELVGYTSHPAIKGPVAI